MAERWTPTREELKRVLEQHKKWLKSEGDEGALADLSGADLRGALLSGAVLSGAVLRRTDLGQADLRDASLYSTDLSNAKLCGADLDGARLGGAILREADFDGANLAGSNLLYANFQGAGLTGTDLGGAILAETIFGGTTIRGAEGLEDVHFITECTIDLRTIEQSWPLPESFLKGCGLSDDYIQFIHDHMMQPIKFYSCFISYSSKDQVFADRLYADLQSKGVRCWFATQDMATGDRIRPTIDRAIRMREKVLVILSVNSMESDWVEDEVDAALEEEKNRDTNVLFPIRLDETVMNTEEAWAAKIRRQRHIGDFRGWKEHDSYTKAFDRLLRDLKAPKATTAPTDDNEL